jgi:hypothetical protein
LTHSLEEPEAFARGCSESSHDPAFQCGEPNVFDLLDKDRIAVTDNRVCAAINDTAYLPQATKESRVLHRDSLFAALGPDLVVKHSNDWHQ